MAFGAGKSAFFKIDDYTGTLVSINSYVSSVTPSFEVETADVTALGATGHSFINTLTNGSLNVEGPFDPAIGTTLWGATGTFGTTTATRTFEWHPQGTASGKPKISGECWITSYEVPGGVDNAVTWSMAIQIDGAITLANN